MDLNAYLDSARAARGIPSDNQLARALGVTRGRVSHLRNGHWMPSDELMARIAELAGENVELALLRLNYWRTRNGAARATYRRMIERVAGSSLALMIGFAGLHGASPAPGAFTDKSFSVYYGNNRRRLRPAQARHALTTSATA